MKKKHNRLVAVLLAAVLILTGLGPIEQVNAADSPQFTVKVSTTTAKPGEEVTAELWLEPNSNLTAIALNFDYDPNTFELTKKIKGPVMNATDLSFATENDDGVSILVDFESTPDTEGGLIYTLKLKVKEDASGTGFIEGEVADAMIMDGEEERTISPGEVTVKTEDMEGNEIDGTISINVPLESLTLNKTEAFTMARGTTDTLSVVASPENALVGKTVKWSSSDSTVVMVDDEGNIEAVGVGTATVSATVEDVTASVEISVNVPLESIQLDKDTMALRKGNSETLTVLYNPEDTTDDKTVEWSSSDESVATVDANGKVTAVKEGTADITAKVGDKTATCVVTVQEQPLASISLNETEITLARDEAQTISVIYNPEDTTDDKTVEWSSADESVATVENGTITGIGIGETQVTAKVGTHTATCTVHVNAPLTAISLNPMSLTLLKNQEARVEVEFDPEDTTDSKEVKWSIDDATVAEIKEDGTSVTVKGLKQGKAILTAETVNGDLQAVCIIEVNEKPIEQITIDPSEKTLEIGESVTCKVTYSPDDTTDAKKVTWSSTDENVATVVDGVITAVGGGTADIIARTENGAVAKCEITVPIHLTGISIEPTSIEIWEGETTEALTVNYEPTNTDDEKTVTWSSSDENIATVNSNGEVTGIKAGTAIITATSTVGGFTSSCEVTVKEILLESISLNKAEAFSMEKGSTETLSVTGTPEGALNGKTVTWSSSDSNVVSVDSEGNIKAVSAGKATVTAQVADKTASVEITVNVSLTAIELSEDSLDLEKGEEATIEVKYIPEDTTDDKTITWSSTDESVATVVDGVVTAVGSGTADIIATTANGITAKCEITVPARLTGISLETTSMEILKNETAEPIKVNYEPEDTEDEKAVTWSSSDESIATVNAGGEITGVKAGTATITATSTVGGFTATCEVTVTEIPLESIAFEEEVSELEEGQTAQLNIIYNPTDTTDEKDVEWSSSDESVATVEDGKITAKKAGSTIITAKVGEKEVSYELKVTEVKSDELESIELNKKGTFVMKRGTEDTLTVTATPEDALEGKTVKWSSSNTKVVKVDKEGNIEAVGIGKATVTAQVEDKTASVTIIVNAPLESISLSPKSLSLMKNQEAKVTVQFNPADTTDAKKVKWSISDSDIAEIKVDGTDVIVKGLKQGKATLKATTLDGKFQAVCVVSVSEKAIEKIVVDPSEKTLEIGESVTCNVKYYPVDTTDETEVTWSSTDENVATVVDGVVTAVGGGKADIIATTANGITAKCKVTVPVHLTGISLDPTTLEVVEGETTDPIKVNYEPEITDDEKAVTWTSSDECVAIVDENGAVTGIKAGTAVITAISKVGGHTASCVVTVTQKEIPLEGIAFEKEISTLQVGEKAQLNIVFNPENTTDAKDIIWSSSDETIATVEDGLLIAVTPGKTTITAKVGDKEVSYELTVTAIDSEPGDDEEDEPSDKPGDKNPENIDSEDNTSGDNQTKDQNLSDKVNKPDNTETIKTGDTANTFSLMLMMILSLSVIAVTVAMKNRKKIHR